MKADRATEALFVLLRSGLWEGPVSDEGLFPLSSREWDDVCGYARRQTVTGLVWHGLEHLPEGFLPPDGVMTRWVAEVERIERRSRRMNSVVEELFGFFGTRGLHPVLLKGQGLARLYSCPLLREAGDIDLWFPTEDERSEAERLLSGGSVTLGKLPDGSISYEWKGIEVEHHNGIIDLHNPFREKQLVGIVGAEGFEVCKPDEFIGAEIRVPSVLLDMMLVNTHILKHAIGRGIGLRQFCDMAVLCNAMRDRIDRAKTLRTYRLTGISSWSRLLHTFIESELGMPSLGLFQGGARPDSSPLAKLILEGGNFGQYKDGDTDVTSRGTLRRKMQTASSFFDNLGFSLRYAPGETFWTALDLVKGQFQC